MRNWGDESSSGSHASLPSQAPSLSLSAMGVISIVRSTAVEPNIESRRDQKIGLADTKGSEIAVAPGSFSEAETKKLLRKLDLHLIPFLALIYLRVCFFPWRGPADDCRLCFLDRTNVGNARLAGLEKDLRMKGLDYNISLAIFFPFYVLAEIPSNMMLKRFRPSVWFTFIMVSWGLIMTCMGLVHNFQGLLACRAFLGLAEGGLFPGITFFITMWYRRTECGFRIALFFSAATAAGAFGGLLARGISEMDGRGGKPAWAWIFILEGLLTMVVGAFAYLAVNDYPST